MALDRFLIAPEEIGLENDLKPWLLPDTGYEQLNNSYVFRGRIRKRFGSRYMVPSNTPALGFEQYPSRLGFTLYLLNNPLNPVLTNGAGVASSNVRINSGDPGLPLNVGQIFTVGTQVFTVISALPGPQPMLPLSTGSTFNITTGDYVINTVPPLIGVGVKFYPGFPVMGLPTWETSTINNEPTIAFDTRYAYQFLANGWERLNLGGNSAIWTGTNFEFFWAYTYQGVDLSQNFLFVTNFNEIEPNFMRYLDQNNTWNNFAPKTATLAGNDIIAARIIVGFHDHLVLLNVWERSTTFAGTLNFKNRARYCAIGSPLDNAAAIPPFFPWIDNKNDPNFRGGGFVDNLQTQQQIVSAEFIKDRLIVYYARETWELVYTGNQQTPFVWQQINTEFGAQSTFSKVPFDKEVLAIAQNGITSCTGSNVQRIDKRIPDEVFDIRNENNGVERVQGIRDFKVEQVYWAYPSSFVGHEFAKTFPNQIFVYNYNTGSWAKNTDSFTAFGYFTQQVPATWGNITIQWQFMTALWSDGALQGNFRQIVAGNQEGYVVIIDPGLTRNAGALQITNAVSIGNNVQITAIDHNLTDVDLFTGQDEYVYIENIRGAAGVAFWTSLNGGIFPIDQIIDKDTFTIAAFPIIDPTPYTGGGTIARVSNLNILSKQWNPYNKQGQNVFIQKMDFLVSRTGGIDEITGIIHGGEVTVDYYPSTSKFSMLNNSVPGQLMSNGVLETKPYPPIFYPFEENQDRVWRPIYYAVDGTTIQIRIFMNDAQIVNPSIAFSDFELHAIILHSMPTSFRIGG